MPARAFLLLGALFLCVPPLFAQAPGLPPPAELPGPLVLFGGGPPSEDVRKAFIELAGKAEARVLVLAADGQDVPLKPWRDLGPRSVALLALRDRTAADDPALVRPLADATGVWLGDAAAFRSTPFEKELLKLHRRGGAVGGASLPDGLLPGFVVEPHFAAGKRAALAAALVARPGRVGLGLDDGAALVVRGRQFRFLGGGSAMAFVAAGAGKPAAATALKAGALLDLFQLRRMAANRAAAEPFPPARVSDPVVEKGALVIVGGGGAGPEVWKRFIELAGGPDALIGFVPTALEDPIGLRFPEVEALRKYGAKSVAVLHARDRAKADDPAFSEPLTRAGGVWFGGGRQWRFVEAYEGTKAEERFRGVLARGGAIGGSSAGASIQSEYMPRGHPLGNAAMMAEGYERGFGFLPGAAVDQHFFARNRTADMTELMAAYPQYLGIGIDEGTAVVARGSTAEVIGRGSVAFYDYRNGRPKGPKDYAEVRPGGAYDMKARKAK